MERGGEETETDREEGERQRDKRRRNREEEGKGRREKRLSESPINYCSINQWMTQLSPLGRWPLFADVAVHCGPALSLC